MAPPRVSSAGGFAALWYVLEKGRQTGVLKLYRRLRSRNACKTCAVGMGGRLGGMVNETGHFPEVCKKSVQAQAGDMAAGIAEEFFAATSIEELERLGPQACEALGRLTFPVVAEPGATHYRRIGWEEALDRAGAALRAAPTDEVFFYVSGRSSNEAAFLFQLVARAYGTANIHNCSYYCHQASGVALGQVYGSGTSSVVLEDLEKADLAVVVGANPASNHPRLLTQLVHLRKRGGKVLVINPLRELGLVRFSVPSIPESMLFGSQIADLYLQPHIGGDVAVFKALLKGLMEREGSGQSSGPASGLASRPASGLDAEFIGARTAGWEAVKADVAATDWDTLVAASGLERAALGEAAEMLAGARRGIFLWAMGLTHHVNGVENILALANVALARGWLGREGAGLLPIRGHSNVQGVGSMGVSPVLKETFAKNLLARYGIEVGDAPGQDTYSSMVAAEAGRIQASVQLGGNLFGSNPDRSWVAGALRRIPLTVAITTKLNEGHIHGRGQTMILLPCLARDEEAQATTQESMFNYVRLSEGGPPMLDGEMRSEVQIVAELAERILPEGRFDWAMLRSHEHLRQEIAAVVPGFAPMREMDASGREFQVEGRTFHGPEFNTADGKAHFHVTPLPKLDAWGRGEPAAWDRGEAKVGAGRDLSGAAERPFRLMTIRSEGQFNTVVYEEEDLYRGNLRRDVVMLAAEDAAALGVAEGDPVVVSSEAGSMRVVAAIVDIRAGNLAMYYPEANVLVPRKLDPQSKTPAFKSVPVTVRRAER